MSKYKEHLYDAYGNSHARRDLSIKSAAIQGSVSAAELQKYQEASAEFKQEEKLFTNSLNDKLTITETALDNKHLDLLKRKAKAELQCDFYKDYKALSYDAQLKYEIAKQEAEQLPLIIESYEQMVYSLKAKEKALTEISSSDEQKISEQYQQLKQDLEADFSQKKSELKKKKDDNLISAKAYSNALAALKREKKDKLLIASFKSDKVRLDAEIKSLKYNLKHQIKRELAVLNSNISDIRRKTPVEVKKKFAINTYTSFFLPGLGQALNKQYIKALFFAIASLFIYFIAIPYALGYGNYQGWGIGGLFTLAEGAKKIDKSLIYMIEGVVSIFLLLIAFVIYLVSFYDVRTVEKNTIKGIRANNWSETKAQIERDGFPYLVSLPALIVTIFIVLVPIATTILLSFTNMDPKHQSKFSWVALDNYKLIATGTGIAGSAFWKIFGWTIIWTLCATSLAILVGFLLAVIVNNERVKGKLFFRSVFLLPWAVPAFITIMFFSIMFSQNGIITSLLETYFGFDVVIKSDPFYSRVVLILLQTWLGSSYVFLLSTGVLQAIPADLYEAAAIDGASSWQKLKSITLPMVLFQTAPLLVSQYTFNFNNFSIIYLFNGGGPFNPVEYGNLAGTTDLLISYVFKLVMVNQYQAIGAAITVVISLGLMVFAFIGFKNSKAFKEERL